MQKAINFDNFLYNSTAHDLLKAYFSTGSMIIFFGFDNSICHFIHVRAVPVNK